MLQKSLNCNSATLDRLCEITAARIAERTYSLALLEGQIKNAADRIASQDPRTKQEEKFGSLRTLPSEKEIKEEMKEEVLLAPFASQTSLEEVGEQQPMPAFPFYYHLPIFFASQ